MWLTVAEASQHRFGTTDALKEASKALTGETFPDRAGRARGNFLKETTMRNVLLLTVASITFSSIPLLAQQAGASAQQDTSASSSAKVEQMSSVSGELECKLDAKSARVGETVVLKTTQKVTTADGTVIPKGARLIGHVTQAQVHDATHAESQLGMAFDRAELKNGQSVPIRSTIERVNPRPDYTASSSMAGSDQYAGPMGGGMAGGRAMGGGRMGGSGLTGGAVERTSVATASHDTASAGQRVGFATEGTAHATEAVAHGSEHVAGNTAANTAGGVHGVAASGGASSSTQAMARSTGIPGVMLRNGDSASASGTLSASKKNVHLDSGTQMDLSFSAAGK
jgi:hypothetical protein